MTFHNGSTNDRSESQYNQPSLFRQRGQGLSIDIRNSMQSVRHRHSGVNRGGVASHNSNHSMYGKSCENFLKSREKARIDYSKMKMVVSDDIWIFTDGDKK